MSAILCEMLVQVPREALEITGTSINIRFGKFGYSMCLFLAKVMPDFFMNFGMTLLKIGHMGYICSCSCLCALCLCMLRF